MSAASWAVRPAAEGSRISLSKSVASGVVFAMEMGGLRSAMVGDAETESGVPHKEIERQ